jgi:hypothetical protein
LSWLDGGGAVGATGYRLGETMRAAVWTIVWQRKAIRKMTARTFSDTISIFLSQMAALQAQALAFFIGSVNGRVLSACRFLLKRLEMG